MSHAALQSARQEWRQYGYLPLVAALGYSVMGLQTYAIGPFVAPLEAQFGWNRAEIMMGLTISNVIGALLNMGVGVMVDRMGPRPVALAGIAVKAGAIMLLATATGALLNWSLLWIVVGLGAMLLQAQVWSSAVASRFDHGRGFAIAVALCGTSFAAAVCPLLATWLIAGYGWRAAFLGIGLVWLVATLPVVFLAFRGKQDDGRDRHARAASLAAELGGMTVREGLRKPAFLRLLFAGFSYAFYTLAMSPNLVPILAEKGLGAMAAAGIASLMGWIAMGGRLSAGFLIDRWRAHLVGAGMFLLPVIGCVLMLTGTTNLALLAAAVAIVGLTIGAEFDVVIYLVSRHFGLRSFGTLMGAVLSAGAAGGAIAPVLSGWIHDVTGSYDAMLVLLIGLMAINALSIGTIGDPPSDQVASGH